jgi:alpha-glucosidase
VQSNSFNILTGYFVIGICSKRNLLLSPSGKIKVTIRVADSIYYSLDVNGRQTMTPSTLALITKEGSLGIQSHLSKQRSRGVNEKIVNPVPHKRKIIPIISMS